MIRRHHFFVSILFIPTLFACSGPANSLDDAGAMDAAVVEAAAEAGAPAMPTLPTVLDYGGPHLASPKVVPIFFPADPNRASVESFLAALPASAYWAATSEYGVGALSSASSIVMPDAAPSAVTDADIRAVLAAHVQGTAADWPAGDQNVYAFFYPSSTKVTAKNGTVLCNGGWDAYHSNVSTGASAGIPYIVLAGCSGVGDGVLDTTTASLSHELVEAATDPLITSAPAWMLTDMDHVIWEAFPGSEIGDMCEISPQSFDRLVGAFYVQRFWSNAAAAKGEDPCTPAVAQPYFVAAPVLDEDVTITNGATTDTTKGVSVPLGETRTIDVVLHATGPAPAWNVAAFDTSWVKGTSQELVLKLDKTTGHDGDVVHLTIKRVAKGTIFGGSLLVVQSTDHDRTNSWVGFVGG
jgi:hypothetical protein